MKFASAFAKTLDETEEKDATLSSRCSRRASRSASFSSKSDIVDQERVERKTEWPARVKEEVRPEKVTISFMELDALLFRN
jgi:hypothetical protein